MAASRCIVALVVALTLSACSLVDIRNEKSFCQQGQAISPELVDQVEVGKTTAQWIRERFGAPQEQVELADGESRYAYAFQEHRNHRTRILFLFRYQSSTIVPRQLTIYFKDQVVSAVEWDGDSGEPAEVIYQRDV